MTAAQRSPYDWRAGWGAGWDAGYDALHAGAGREPPEHDDLSGDADAWLAGYDAGVADRAATEAKLRAADEEANA